MANNKLLTFAEYGRKHGVSRQRVSAWVKDKQVRCVNVGGGIRLIREDTPRPERCDAGRPKNKC